MELMTIDEMRECYKEDKKRFVKAIILHLYCYDVREGITAKLYDIDGDLDDPLEYAFFGLVLVPTRHPEDMEFAGTTDSVDFDEIIKTFDKFGKLDAVRRAVTFDWATPPLTE